MATNNLSSSIVLQLLTNENYENWKAWMKNYLLAHDLWDIVEATTEPPKPEDDVVEFKAWRKNNAAALHAIQISCGLDILPEIREIDSAKIVWDKLATMYGPGNSSSITADPLSNIQGEGSINNDLLQHEPLRTAINNGDWVSANDFLSRHENAKSAKISVNGRSVLHVAVFSGHTEIVEKLVELMSAEELAIKDDYGLTALAQAAILQNTRMVGCMIAKNTHLLNIPDNLNRIPLVRALEYGNIEVARYLYSVSLPFQTLSDIDASMVLTQLINLNNFDVALHLLQRCPASAVVPNNHLYNTPLAALAWKSAAFPSGNQLVFWKKWIYALLCLLCWPASNLLKLLGIKQIYEMKLLHHQARQLLLQLCSQVKQMDVYYVNKAIFQAIKGGVIEFIVELVKVDHQLLYTFDEMARNIFYYAVLHRQAKIFSLIYWLDGKNSISNAVDTSRNTILHMAGMLEPSTKRDRIAGEALKMQSELQWFKEVERICPPIDKEFRNNMMMTARELFTHNHKDMVKEGEKWMKDTASSCTVVGALIITIMFTAAFTVPGGNNQNTGFPMFKDKKLFTVFIISDALSLFSSSTSVLVFLGILTSRYAEEDFLRSLPTKMITGLSTLFFSIATMMIAFCAGLFIMLPEKSWMVIPVICLASVTVILFGFMQFPILFDMIKSTYGPETCLLVVHNAESDRGQMGIWQPREPKL
ncbi:ankyrin repeat-containing protein NPR4-like isoform X2 [Alnus glutinosa]|uniref:ankyrin repeat-containing protein NPR4-like isoform X2 n=1 Tax=Alnus glutinosa TaxID=3517 RepID=UPI002D77FE02|nr:ankyrin repeat-containing protein NPR4-like isoform X2 [Alnus glutinosa]